MSTASRPSNPVVSNSDTTPEFADAPRVSASDAKNSFGRILDRVAREGRVAITKHDEPCAMLISIDEYRNLVETGKRAVDTLSEEFDGLYERLQRPGAAAAMQKAFAMTPAELGRAAATSHTAAAVLPGKPQPTAAGSTHKPSPRGRR